MKESKFVATLTVGACALIGLLGLVQFAQIIQWVWLNVSITVK
jgi:hypothetical protein